MQLELVFIRHGQTAGNEQRRYIGQSDDQPLSEAGRAPVSYTHLDVYKRQIKDC